MSTHTQQEHFSKAILPSARKHLDNIQFGTVDVNVFPRLVQEMHLETSPWPAFAIHELKQNYKYPLIRGSDSSQVGLRTEDIAKFTEDFVDGNLKPSIKSAPVSTPQESSPVIEVVGLSYQDVVLNNDKDVLLEFYTQSCGPCKALLPAFQDLARRYVALTEQGARDLVTIAKVDFEANDVPDRDVRGAPWFKLYPAGKKDKPVTYTGERRVAAWAEFIEEHGTNGVGLDISV